MSFGKKALLNGKEFHDAAVDSKRGSSDSVLNGPGSVKADLIVNGGFESGSLTPGWDGEVPVAASGIGGITAYQGTYFLYLAEVGRDLAISQTLNTTVSGQSYDLQFFYYRDGNVPSDLKVYWDGTVVYSEVDSLEHGWQQHDITVVGTGHDTLMIAGRNDPGNDGIDNVSLNAIPSVPEPPALCLLGIGIVGVAGYAVRRRTSATA